MKSKLCSLPGAASVTDFLCVRPESMSERGATPPSPALFCRRVLAELSNLSCRLRGPEPWRWPLFHPLSLSPGLEALEDCFSRGGEEREEREEDAGRGPPPGEPSPPGSSLGAHLGGRVLCHRWGLGVGQSPALKPPGEPLTFGLSLARSALQGSPGSRRRTPWDATPEVPASTEPQGSAG